MSTATRITYDQYEEMIRRGDFDDEDPRRFELMWGELLEMPAPNPPHERPLDILNEWSFENLPRRAVWVRIRQSIGIPALDSVPVPDLTWVRRADYGELRPQPADVLLIVEVSSSSLSYDRNAKARLYADAGLPDYWIVNVAGRSLEIRRDPGPRGYATTLVLRPGEEARPLTFPGLALPISTLFPE